MSINALNWVAQHSASKVNDRLVLFGIADAADRNGHNAWPTIETLAEFANVDRRTVQRAIAALRDLGELSVEKNMGGGSDWRGNRRPNRYSLPQMFRGDTAVTPSDLGVTNPTVRGDKLPVLGVTLLSQEQRQNTHIERRAFSPVDIAPDPDISSRVAEIREAARL